MDLRIGNGYDIHRLVSGRPLIIGGVQLEHTLGLEGNTDADVLIHAVIDALLGALSLGDIGHHFPPNDPQWKGASSAVLLSHVMDMVKERGWEIVNIDSIVVSAMVACRCPLSPEKKITTLLFSSLVNQSTVLPQQLSPTV